MTSPPPPDATLESLFKRLRQEVRAACAIVPKRRLVIVAEIVVGGSGRVVSARIQPPWIECEEPKALDGLPVKG